MIENQRQFGQGSAPRLLHGLEQMFVVVMLFYTTGALLPIITDRFSGYFGLGKNAIELAMQTAFYAVAFCFISLQGRQVARNAWKIKWILALLFIVFASTAWSQDPLITLRRAIVLGATTAFGIYFATRFDISDQLRLLACACGLVICASFACVILFPQYGIDHTVHYGDWQGAFYQKNMLARAMVLSSLVFGFVRFRSGSPLRWLGMAGALSLLILSRSVTGIVVFAIIFASLPMYRLFRTNLTFALPVLLVILSLLAVSTTLAYAALPDVLQLVGRNEGLTGRIDLWNAVLLSISAKPWLGYGFDSFWLGLQGESANVLLAVGWAPAYAHNGFLDLVLELGLLGLVTFVVGYFKLWQRAIVFLSRKPGPTTMWLGMYLAFMVFYNLTEGPVLSQNNITWVLYVATAVSLTAYLPDPGAAAEKVTL